METPFPFFAVLAGDDEIVESRAAALFEKLKSGEITVSDLMGPLFGDQNLSSNLSMPAGEKNPVQVAPTAEVLPHDNEYNRTLIENIFPLEYSNPAAAALEEYDLVAIGGGVGGLITVIIGAWLGKSCALIERHGMGGDCLNTGCVPSKSLIACANMAHSLRNLHHYGITLHPNNSIQIDFAFIMQRMRAIRAKISHHDSVARYRREFCKDVFLGQARFVGPDNLIEIHGNDGSTRLIRFKKAMIATGASASIPRVLKTVSSLVIPHLTNSNFFNLTELPPRVVVIGLGAVGLELGQALARLGAKCVCIDAAKRLLIKEDADAAAALQLQLEEDGIDIHVNTKLKSVVYVPPLTNEGERPSECRYAAPWGTYTVTTKHADGTEHVFECEAFLNATGRTPNVFDCGLDSVGVDWDNKQGVHINEFFQTNNPNIYAVGDCASPYKFTHAADFQARLAVRNMFLGNTHTQDQLLIPWCVYTDPQIAHVGKYECELTCDASVEFETFTRYLRDVDRCLCDGLIIDGGLQQDHQLHAQELTKLSTTNSNGFVRIHMCKRTARILGATIVGTNAGDMISEITFAMQVGATLPSLGGTMHPYPTAQEAIRQCALMANKYYKNPQGVCLKALKLFMNNRDQQLRTSQETGNEAGREHIS